MRKRTAMSISGMGAATFMALMVFCSSPRIAAPQTGSAPADINSPKDVVQDFWKLETSGGRLTDSGWHDASRFFVRMTPSAGPSKKVIHVTRPAGTARVEETARTESWAEVSVSPYVLGEIGPSLQFTSTPERGAYGVVLLGWTTETFHVVLTSEQWTINVDGGRNRETDRPPKWLIDCDRNELWIDKYVAIRYVTEMRDRSTDAAIRRHADETLATLRKIH